MIKYHFLKNLKTSFKAFKILDNNIYHVNTNEYKMCKGHCWKVAYDYVDSLFFRFAFENFCMITCNPEMHLGLLCLRQKSPLGCTWNYCLWSSMAKVEVSLGCSNNFIVRSSMATVKLPIRCTEHCHGRSPMAYGHLRYTWDYHVKSPKSTAGGPPKYRVTLRTTMSSRLLWPQQEAL